MLRMYPVELSCVGGVYAPVGCRDPVYNSAADGKNKLGLFLAKCVNISKTAGDTSKVTIND